VGVFSLTPARSRRESNGVREFDISESYHNYRDALFLGSTAFSRCRRQKLFQQPQPWFSEFT
jgi:hypothetical protein